MRGRNKRKIKKENKDKEIFTNNKQPNNNRNGI
jgi:hypothetical protein